MKPGFKGKRSGAVARTPGSLVLARGVNSSPILPLRNVLSSNVWENDIVSKIVNLYLVNHDIMLIFVIIFFLRMLKVKTLIIDEYTFNPITLYLEK